ncbi:MAG: hypothetical protein ACTSPB_01225 [Candidatus Thorarchaeota archaeon]
MVFPKHYVGRYPKLAKHLSENGFIVYSMEMVSREIVHPKNYVVDVVAVKSNEIWAFEYKSFNDPVKKAKLQVENYVKCFDRVVVVAENLTALTRHREFFRELGVGVWWVKDNVFEVLDEPQLQNPTLLKKPNFYHNCNSIRDVMMSKFKRYMGLQKYRKLSLHQKDLKTMFVRQSEDQTE